MYLKSGSVSGSPFVNGVFENSDPTTGIRGIKFEPPGIATGGSRDFYVTLKGYWPEGLGQAATKSGTKVCYYEVNGPKCLSDLYVTKRATPDCDEIRYSIEYGNRGTDRNTNVTMVDDYDQNKVTVKPGTITGGGIDDGDKITWSIGVLQARDYPYTVNYAASFKPGLASGTKIVNEVGIQGDQPESSMENNRARQETQGLPVPTVTIAATGVLTCSVKSVTLNATVSPEGTYSYKWRDAGNNVISTSEDLVTSEPGTYTLNVTGTNGCITTKTVIVSRDISVPTVTIAAPGALNCTMTSVTINATVTPEGTYTYRWMDEENSLISTSEDLVTSLPGTYTLNVTGTNGCITTKTVTVTQDLSVPTVEIDVPDVLTCTVTSVTINATVTSEGTYTISWMDEDNNIISTSEDLVTSSPGTYTLNVTGTNGCITTKTVTVTQDPSVPAVTIAAPGTLNCTVTSVTINATVTSEGTYTYEWMDEENSLISTSEDLVTSSPGTYTLNVTGTNGCTPQKPSQ